MGSAGFQIKLEGNSYRQPEYPRAYLAATGDSQTKDGESRSLSGSAMKPLTAFCTLLSASFFLALSHSFPPALSQSKPPPKPSTEVRALLDQGKALEPTDRAAALRTY